MKKTLLLSLFTALAVASIGQSFPSKAAQIASAVLAAPEEVRVGATVLGYDTDGTLVTLRKGINNQVCLADNPLQEGFSVACYHEDLSEFMSRGRALKALGKNRSEIFEIREQEAKAGTLKMPNKPTTLHIFSGDDQATATLRYVVYIPWATAQSTGLPIRPLVPGGPWIMDPGTHRAHIMISPPKELQNKK